MDSSKKQPPLRDYVTKLLLLELVRCNAAQNQDGIKWIEQVLNKLAESTRK